MAGDSISRFFKDLPDSRGAHGKRHRLTDMMAITICAVICGADGWVEVEDFGKAQEGWLKSFLALPHGIPSHDTFGRVFAALDPAAMERCFLAWTAALAKMSQGQLIAIDGKTLRRSFDRAGGKTALHLVNAWCLTNRLVLGQLATDLKSNEITAIPKLLELLELRGAIVTIDAIGCQKDIAAKIIEGGGDYLLQIKANQPTLLEEVQLLFDEAIGHRLGVSSLRSEASGSRTGSNRCQQMGHARYETIEKDHGRIETRRLYSTWEVGWFTDRNAWAALGSFACVESTRQVEGKVSTERRYYLSSLDGRDARRMLEAVRGHWSVQNSLHWSLDVTFREDDCRVRQGHAAEHLARIRRLVLGLLKRETTFKAGLKRKRMRCALDHDYLLKVLAS